MRTLIILVNRNNKKDTIECLESLRRCEGDFDVFVSDNASTDGSLESIREWAEGKIAVDTSQPAWDDIRGHRIEHPDLTWGIYASEEAAKADPKPRWLTVASTGGSKGFPAGNNVGMRYGLTRAYDYFWILNNDTVVEPTALVRLVAKMQSDPTIGVCASTLVYYHRPHVIQAWGGGPYNHHFAASSARGYGKPFPPAPAPDVLEPADIVLGAAMFVSREMLEKVGLMNDQLYLYFEEIDWSIRMTPFFKNGYEPQSIVYHKHGGTMGGAWRKPSRHRVYYMTINRILFTKTHFPASLPTVVAAILVQAVRNTLRGRLSVSYWILKDLSFALTKARYPLTELP